MNYRNCSLLNVMLILLLLDGSRTENRVKRLSSPFCDEKTHELEKYVVSIRSRRPQIRFGDNHFCVGTIVAPKFIITTAKCTMSHQKVMHLTRSLIAVGGTPNRLISISNTVKRSVEKIFVPKFYLTKNTNNIALLQLVEAWPTDNSGIGIINLPNKEPDNSTTLMVLGWGRFYKDGPLAGNLVHIKVKLLEREQCEQMIKKLQPEMFCAGNASAISDSHPCAGDSGGPMIYNHTIYGVVSYRTGCGYTTMPSIYTNVWYHMDWINEVIRNCSYCAVQTKVYIVLLSLITLSVWRTN